MNLPQSGLIATATPSMPSLSGQADTQAARDSILSLSPSLGGNGASGGEGGGSQRAHA